MADQRTPGKIGPALGVVLTGHLVVLGLVLAGGSPALRGPSPPPSIMIIVDWQEPPRPAPAQSVSHTPLPRPVVPEVPRGGPPTAPDAAVPEPEGQPGPPSETATVSEAAPAPQPEDSAEIDYLPQGEVTAPVVPAKELLARIHYPDRARKQSVQATVSLELFIDANGVIRRVEILKDPGYGFAEAALQALEGLRCQPATVSGKPVAVRFRYPVRFTLK